MEYIPEIVIGILSCIGTLIGSLAGIHKANELTNYRIKQLESKVNKCNNRNNSKNNNTCTCACQSDTYSNGTRDNKYIG